MWKELIKSCEIDQHNYGLVFLGMVDAFYSCGPGAEEVTVLEKHTNLLAPHIVWSGGGSSKKIICVQDV